MSVGEGIIMAKVSGEILLFNAAAERITGYQQEEVLHRNVEEIFTVFDVRTGEQISDYLRGTDPSEEQPSTSIDFGVVAKNGTKVRLSVNVSLIKATEQEEAKIVVSFRDISREYELEKQVEGFLNVNLDLLCVSTLEGVFVRVNKKFEEVLGYRTSELEGMNHLSLVHPEDQQKTIEAMRELGDRRIISGRSNRYRRKDGSYIHIEWQAQPGFGNLVYASGRDVTEQWLMQEKLLQSAIKDELTGLYNRHFFETIIHDQIQHADRYQEPLSMILLDLDHFKQVNDTWGHQVGDEVLQVTGETIEHTIRESDYLIRYGGEEFLILMPQTGLAGAMVVAEKIREAIEAAPLQKVGVRTASLGVAERKAAETLRDWYQRLDQALYQAKQQGRNRVISSDEKGS